MRVGVDVVVAVRVQLHEHQPVLGALAAAGREKAIAILTVLLGQVPDQAKAGITKAIAALSQHCPGA